MAFDDTAGAPCIRFGGSFSGPVLEVTAPSSVIRALALRMDAIPSLPWMRGQIVLRLCAGRSDGADASLALSSDCAKSNLMTVLGKATSLGMISGRGVSRPKPQSAVKDRFRA